MGKFAKFVGYVVIFLVGLTVLGSCFGGDEEEQTQEATQGTTQETVVKEEPKEYVPSERYLQEEARWNELVKFVSEIKMQAVEVQEEVQTYGCITTDFDVVVTDNVVEVLSEDENGRRMLSALEDVKTQTNLLKNVPLTDDQQQEFINVATTMENTYQELQGQLIKSRDLTLQQIKDEEMGAA